MKQFGMFAVAGTVGFVVDVVVLLLCNVIVGPHIGRLVSFTAAVITTWLINRKHTFSYSGDSSLLREFSRYYTSALGGGAVNILSYSVVVKLFELSPAWLPLAVAFGSLSGMIVNFLLAKHFVFTYSK
jgi:putative flippase GtrA